MAKQEMTHYRTADLYFSAFLVAMDCELKDTEKKIENGKEKTVFIFNIPKGQEKKLKWLYFGNKGMIPPLTFVNAIRMLKELTHT